MVENLQKNARSHSLADFAARIKKGKATTDDGSRLGDELKPKYFTKFFVGKPSSKSLVALRKYMLPIEIEKLCRQAIRRANKRKAAGPEGVPMELLQICQAELAELLHEFFAAGARLQCFMKDLDFSIFIPIYKRKEKIAVPENHRLLRFIFILQKIFEMETTVRLVRETSDELDQFGFSDSSMTLTPVTMVVSAASLQHVLLILLKLIKAYDLVQRN